MSRPRQEPRARVRTGDTAPDEPEDTMRPFRRPDPSDTAPADGPPQTTEVGPVRAPRPVTSPWGDSLGRVAIRAAQVLLVVAASALVVYVLVTLRIVVVPLIVAAIIASAVAPVLRLLRRRGVPAGLSAWAALATGLGVLGLLGWLIVAAVRDEWDELRDQATEGLEELEQFVTDGPLPITPEQLERAREAIIELASGEEFRAGALSGAVAAVEVVAGLFLTVVILFFLLRDGRRIWDFLLRVVPDEQRSRVDLIGERSVEVLGGYVRGTAIIALVDAVVIGAALFILRVPLALPLAVIVFVTAFIPLVGATLAGALAALVALVANGPVTALIVVAVVVAVNQLEGDLLAPVVLGRALSLHPLVILLALSAGTIIAGVLGALFSVPLVAVVWSAITTWVESQRGPQTLPGSPAPSPSGPS